MIPTLIDSVCKLAISGDEIIIITMISKYFQVWNNIDEKFVKIFCCSLIFRNYFFWNYFLFTLLPDNFFFPISVILDFIFILWVKNDFIVFQKVLLSVMSLLLILLKKFFFSLLVKFTKRLRCLLYAFLTFLRRYLFMISSFIFLFKKSACFTRTYRFFMGACLWIDSSRAALNRSKSRSLFSNVIWIILFNPIVGGRGRRRG